MEQKTGLKTQNRVSTISLIDRTLFLIDRGWTHGRLKKFGGKMKARLSEYELDRPSLHSTAKSDSNFD
jgi:hypothetical protein